MGGADATMKSTIGHRIRSAACAIAPAALLAAALLVGACDRTMTQRDPNAIPEMASPDWKTLRGLVKQYESTRAEIEQRSVTVIQSKFSDLVSTHGSDRIGDEALYYVGRIYYDMRDYHDARVTFAHHKEIFTKSEFTPTILQLEAEMNKNKADYEAWLNQSRTTSSVTR